MAKLTLRDVDVRGKRVLVRVDFNVPIKEDGDEIEITDDTRIREALPTINYLSHFGRPKGKRVQKYTLRPVGDHLHTLIGQPVVFSHDTIGEVPEKIIAAMQDGDVALLQNLRFQPGEEANDPKFASALAEFGDVYVNDAFGAAHRAHASTVGVTMFIEKRAMGFLMEKELKYLHEKLDNPAKPFVVIMGGAKVSDKIGVLKALMKKADVRQHREELRSDIAGRLAAFTTGGSTGEPLIFDLSKRRTAYRVSLPNRVVAVVPPGTDLPADHPAHGKGLVGGKPAAYVCEGPVCSLPLTDPDALMEHLTQLH